MEGFVVSDLHLFSDRSSGEDYFPELTHKARSVSAIVLNGDTFDLAWTNRASAVAAAQEGVALIERLARNNPSCHVFYIVGNHDCSETLISGLCDLAKRYSNVSVHEEYLQLGDKLFVHGDVCNYSMSAAELGVLRQQYAQVVLRPRWLKALYKLVILFRLNRVAYMTHNPETMAERILSYLGNSYPELLNSARFIYYGHTHAPSEYHHTSGVTFINTGSTIRGMKHNFQAFSYEK
jgi:UDP-2,3-diacylglucosamine pyrophosphatase LpxH